MTDDEREADVYRLEPKGARYWIDRARRALAGEEPVGTQQEVEKKT